MRTLLALVCLALLAPSTVAQELPAETLQALKRSTVFIKVEGKKLSASGSGFVVATEKDRTLIATNHHVVSPAPDGRPPAAPEAVRVTAVFNSGTRDERGVAAEILAVDPVRDLAVIAVKGVPDNFTPIDYLAAPKLVETMPVYVLGFPFGRILATTKGSPAITVGKASVSSLRLGEDGELAIVQIDGALNPGNSGGPVVDSKGQLIGVAVATIKNSSGIGLAIPSGELVQIMQGRVGRCSFSPGKAPDGGAGVRVEVPLIDPLRKVFSVSLHYLRPGKGGARPAAGERLADRPGARKVLLRLDADRAGAEFPLEGGAGGELLVQLEYANATGKRYFTPITLEPLARREVAAAPAPKNAGAAPAPRRAVRRDKDRPDDETEILGGAFDATFRDVSPKGGVLIGLQVGLGRFVNRDIIIAIRPMYWTPLGGQGGKMWGTNGLRAVTLRAKQGYAVGAITAKAGLTVDGFKVTFMKLTKDGRLDPNDSYESDWVGGTGGGKEVKLGGDGTRVIGICGKHNQRDCTGLGLILQKADKDEEK